MQTKYQIERPRFFELLRIFVLITMCTESASSAFGGEITARTEQSVITGEGRLLDPTLAANLDTCVQDTYNQFVANSESTCAGQMHSCTSGNTEDRRCNFTYTMGPDFDGYQYITGSQSTNFNDICVFDMNGTAVTAPTTFLCVLHTEGCGAFKDGGHINGACSVKIHYIPRAGDITKIKEYCFGILNNIALPKPTSYQIGCTLP